MPTITTVDAAWTPAPVEFTHVEARLFDTAIFAGDGSPNGVRGGVVYHGPDSLKVTVDGTDRVSVGAGAVVIPAATGLGVYRAALAAGTTAEPLTPRNSTNPRIDLIVAQATGTNVTLKTIDGTPGASPSAPDLPAQHVEIARVNVPKLGPGAITVDQTWRTYATALGGRMLVETAARLPGSGMHKGQEAVALDTGIGSHWTGTQWLTDEAEVAPALTAGAGLIVAYRRRPMVTLTVDFTATSAIAAFATLTTIPPAFRPLQLHGTVINNNTGAAISLLITTGGAVQPRSAIASGHQLLGSITVPLAPPA